jgi:hypothetical protein
MDHVKAKQRLVNPEEITKSFLKRSSMRNIFRRGVKDKADIYEVLPSFKCQTLGDEL